MKDFFKKWYRYNAWANKRVIRCLQEQDVRHEKILQLFSHLLSAQYIWLGRIEGSPIDAFPLWKTYSLEELAEMVTTIAERWNRYVESHETNRLLKYHNYTGQYFENEVEQIMTHLVNHGTYHRGQIALLLRQQGYTPVNTDYITFDRVETGQLKDE